MTDTSGEVLHAIEGQPLFDISRKELTAEESQCLSILSYDHHSADQIQTIQQHLPSLISDNAIDYSLLTPDMMQTIKQKVAMYMTDVYELHQKPKPTKGNFDISGAQSPIYKNYVTLLHKTQSQNTEKTSPTPTELINQGYDTLNVLKKSNYQTLGFDNYQDYIAHVYDNAKIDTGYTKEIEQVDHEKTEAIAEVTKESKQKIKKQAKTNTLSGSLPVIHMSEGVIEEEKESGYESLKKEYLKKGYISEVNSIQTINQKIKEGPCIFFLGNKKCKGCKKLGPSFFESSKENAKNKIQYVLVDMDKILTEEQTDYLPFNHEDLMLPKFAFSKDKDHVSQLYHFDEILTSDNPSSEEIIKKFEEFNEGQDQNIA